MFVQPMPGMQRQPLAISAAGHFIAQELHRRHWCSVIQAKPSALAGLLLVIEQGSATGVQRTATPGRGVVMPASGPGDAATLADCTHTVQRSATHAHETDVQCQAQLCGCRLPPLRSAPARLDQLPARTGVQVSELRGRSRRPGMGSASFRFWLPRLEGSLTIRGEIPNSNPFEINKLPAHARAVCQGSEPSLWTLKSNGPCNARRCRKGSAKRRWNRLPAALGGFDPVRR